MTSSVLAQCQQLQSALASADPSRQAEAERIAQALAASRCRVRVYADSEAGAGATSAAPLGEDTLLVSVTFQTRAGAHSRPVTLALSRDSRVADLKAELLLAFDLPVEVQRCIVDGRMPLDNEELRELVEPDAMLRVRTYLLTDSAGSTGPWPPTKEWLEVKKQEVLAERERRSTLTCDAEVADEVAEEVAAEEAPEAEEREPGWCCAECTFFNPPGRPGCCMCGAAPPEGYEAPVEFLQEQELQQQRLEAAFLRQTDLQRERNRDEMLTIAQDSLIPVANQHAFECPICLCDIGGDADADEAVGGGARGVRLRECGHEVCSNCLHDHAVNAESLPVRCPCEPCQQTVTDAELSRLLNAEELARLHRRGLRQAEGVITNAFHCVTTNCEGFVELVDEVNDFKCPVCDEHNCVPCRASHKDLTCRQYQDELQRRAQNDESARKGLEKIEELIASGEAMRCPKCRVFLQKRDGCDWLQCSVCRTEICWATRGPRWGPAGKGDTSGGCRCRLGGRSCHPQCMNCH